MSQVPVTSYGQPLYQNGQNYNNGFGNYGNYGMPYNSSPNMNQIMQTNQKLQNMEQQNPHLFQNNSQQQMQQSVQQQIPQTNQVSEPKLISVNSETEARNYFTGFDSTLFVFYDANNAKIYTKKFHIESGGIIFNTFSRIESEEPKIIPEPQQDQTEESNSNDNDIEALKNQVAVLINEFEILKGEILNVQSNGISTNDGGAKPESTANVSAGTTDAGAGTSKPSVGNKHADTAKPRTAKQSDVSAATK